ncbi:hypothetical protein SELMODRAFT_166350 [Selaginella moellendorffii]|uniref:B-keto acyl reductase n=1 Tax=Selaginella moellendorffii TaxID=88036 RepID=D8QX87_SELML|nr:very-long-chain 3-oxoacyl-CoA reductase 1 [Selaginella moellendorffii]EFJ35368.1 hypothetical protein SELMODRAFT_166350 [Selaginella moellendorffii]|eukprot:XP_002963497.1 very-long-chain 3-oxoacyl-CoA reductase 1 [Selaginella moellendorffii]
MHALLGRILSAPPEQLLFLVFALLGTYCAIKAGIQFATAIWIVLLRPGKNLHRYGSWAVVTGASDGIGRAVCFQLAARGINVVAVGRTESKLEELVRDIQRIYSGVLVKFVVLDFASEKLEAGLKSIGEVVEGLEVGILVNNVGVSYPYARYFHEVDGDLLERLVRVNVVATTRMSQLLVPQMLKRRKGAIVNIGSGSGTILPSDPLYAIYAATKGYIEILSRSMYNEYRHCGIDVQCQVPLYVKTKMAKIRNTSLTVPSPEAYAKSALRSIGYEAVATPYWAHHLLWWLISLVPERIVSAIRLSSNLDLRRRGQAKDAKAKAN